MRKSPAPIPPQRPVPRDASDSPNPRRSRQSTASDSCANVTSAMAAFALTLRCGRTGIAPPGLLPTGNDRRASRCSGPRHGKPRCAERPPRHAGMHAAEQPAVELQAHRSPRHGETSCRRRLLLNMNVDFNIYQGHVHGRVDERGAFGQEPLPVSDLVAQRRRARTTLRQLQLRHPAPGTGFHPPRNERVRSRVGGGM